MDGKRFENKTFQVPSADEIKACPTYDAWPYGIAEGKGDSFLLPPYVPKPQRKDTTAFLETNVTYFVGAADNSTNTTTTAKRRRSLPSCGPELQGRNRVERLQHYAKYAPTISKSAQTFANPIAGIGK